MTRGAFPAAPMPLLASAALGKAAFEQCAAFLAAGVATAFSRSRRPRDGASSPPGLALP